MSLKFHTPCDDGDCPYDATYYHDCEYWCGEDAESDSYNRWDCEPTRDDWDEEE